MLKINTDVNLESKPMDISPPIETHNPSDTTEKKPEEEGRCDIACYPRRNK